MKIEDFQDILFEKEENGIVTVTLNRPERKNALSALTLLELWYALEHAEKDKKIKVLILTGQGDAFCSGGYFSQDALKGIPKKHLNEVNWKDLTSKKLCLKFWDFTKPIIAAVNGLGVGAGFNIPVLCADFTYASEKAWFGLYMIKRAVIGDMGSTLLLPLLIGFRKAKELFYLGNKLTAQEAEELGLINKVVAHDELIAYSKQQALRLMPPKSPTLALKLMKKSIHTYYRALIETHCDLENEYWLKCIRNKDFTESLNALKEKREPNFK
ncbi:MAG: enoyl-CoA hydratase/isomerase family protein [Promethearchaeota archaeon]|nr:MAG: enoyl-CoA hydratase/isomerase family protein [Candidatus Lokiarchaeota archaeon]